VSTEWHFFAFDSAAFERHVTAPLLQAVSAGDVHKWAAALKKLEEVHPPSAMTRYGLYGSKYPVTAVDWYTGHSRIEPTALPDPETDSLDAFMKLVIESVSEFRLTGRWLKPNAVFSELGFPESLPSQGEQEEFRLWADSLFWRRTDQPSGYEFLGRLNQRAAVLLPPEVAHLAAEERRVGLFRRLATDLLASEWRGLAVDLKALMAFVELTETYGLALYYREDGT
jgi:hypothetical protein